MRKQIDGLIGILKTKAAELTLKEKNLYIFCGKDKTKIKILEIDYSGIWIYYKRTNGDKFFWPKDSNTKIIDKRQLGWLLEGLSIIQKNAHTNKQFQY